MRVIPFKEIMINAIGSFFGGLFLLWLAVGTSGIKSLRSRFGRPNIEIQIGRAPRNIFTGIQLGSSASWVQQQLGHPAQIGDCWWGYKYLDALVSLEFDSQMAVETLAVALVDDKSTFYFPAVHFDCPPLGKAMLSDVLAEHLQLEYVDSMRHSELLIYGREGPPGAWHYITFGVLSPHVPGSLLEIQFKWDKDAELLLSPKNKVKINWAALSRRSGPAHFPWDLALNLQC